MNVYIDHVDRAHWRFQIIVLDSPEFYPLGAFFSLNLVGEWVLYFRVTGNVFARCARPLN